MDKRTLLAATVTMVLALALVPAGTAHGGGIRAHTVENGGAKCYLVTHEVIDQALGGSVAVEYWREKNLHLGSDWPEQSVVEGFSVSREEATGHDPSDLQMSDWSIDHDNNPETPPLVYYKDEKITSQVFARECLGGQ